MNWRNHLPANCPPADASPASGIVYRLAEKDAFDGDDFLSQRELHPHKSWGVDECIACGISVYTEYKGVEQLKRRIPAMRRKTVLHGNLVAKHGKMKHTPSKIHSSHHTWWIPRNEEPWTVFEIVQRR